VFQPQISDFLGRQQHSAMLEQTWNSGNGNGVSSESSGKERRMGALHFLANRFGGARDQQHVPQLTLSDVSAIRQAARQHAKGVPCEPAELDMSAA